MTAEILFYAVFLSQVLLLSYFLPRQVLERVRHVVENYPPETHPRLYPVSLQQTERARRNYRNMNLLVLAVGAALIGYGIYARGEELLVADTTTVVFLYYMLQYSPLLIATTAGFTYFNLKRKPDARNTRTAELRRRRLLDYVSPALVGTAAAAYLAFIVFVGWMRTFGFPWFGGWLNVAGITAMNLLFAALIGFSLYGRKRDPYMASADRDRIIATRANVLILISIAATAYVSLAVTLNALDLRAFAPVAQSLYFQVISVAAFRGFRIDDVNFEVYREESAAA